MNQNDEWVTREVRIPGGAFLATSHETPGAERALLFDRESSSNLGPAELRVPKDEGLSPEEMLIAAALIAVGVAVHAVVVKSPEIKRGLNEKVLPAFKAKWTALRTRGADSNTSASEDRSPDAETGPFLTLVDSEADKPADSGSDEPGSAAPAV